MLNMPVVTLITVVLTGCAAAGGPPLPPPPQQPATVDPHATSVDSGLLLSAADQQAVLQLANAGDPDAAFRLSLHFMSAGDTAQQRHWQLVAAQNGHHVAQYNQWFDRKDAVDCDSKNEALAWLKAAAEGGLEDAKQQLEEQSRAPRTCAPRK